MEVQDLIDNIQDLSDLELATLLCLIAKEHCLFETAEELVDDLASELALIVSEGFGLSYRVLSSDDLGSIDSFGDAILDESTEKNEASDGDASLSGYQSQLADVQVRAGRLTQQQESKLDTRKIVNVVIARDFNQAPKDVQVQAIELIRRRRMYSRTTIHACPDPFLFLPITSTSSKHIRLNKHLNDRIFISHVHYRDDGFPNLEEMEDYGNSDDQTSTSSIVRRSTSNIDSPNNGRRIDMKTIDRVRVLGDSATMALEVRRYLSNLVVFMRYERGVAGGISPHASILFEKLSKYLAPLHSLSFVTPSLIALAAKKIYPHRILIASPERERSIPFGSNVEVIRTVLQDVTPETVIDAVLERVACPL